MTTVATIHPVMEDDVNSIDPSLLATGLHPGSLIPNCGPNDCPNPFSSQSDAPPQNTFVERIVEVPPSARGSYPAQSPPLEPPANDETALTTGGTQHAENWPPWFAEACTYLGRFKLGAKWECLVDLLTQVERRAGFVKSEKPLQCKFRPSQVSLWIQNARLRDPTPLEERDAFVTAWWLWWRDMQPKSRGLADGEGSVPASMCLDEGDWGNMSQPGQNSLYSVIAALGWWGEDVLRSPGA
ncbi:hypothetical protein IW262DRAFT_1461076 [Armillaria fumosa]|nr:hypothetical protein IW262DRAFT_1461076 [Armillaria fumosa]